MAKKKTSTKKSNEVKPKQNDSDQGRVDTVPGPEATSNPDETMPENVVNSPEEKSETVDESAPVEEEKHDKRTALRENDIQDGKLAIFLCAEGHRSQGKRGVAMLCVHCGILTKMEGYYEGEKYIKNK